MSELLVDHGLRIADAIDKPLKMVVTAGDGRVCPACRQAEEDGAIPVEQAYSNGHQHPPFHPKNCRCKEFVTGQPQVVVRPDEVLVGYFDEQSATAATLAEYGSGNGPPRPEVRQSLENDDLFKPLENDIYDYLKNIFLK